ncbi:transposase [uncultured Endozoicomonas sp.]|nr:transposase [uncultured Endozoicomonas sp.]
MTKQRKNYSPEFKRKAIAMVVEQNQAVIPILFLNYGLCSHFGRLDLR